MVHASQSERLGSDAKIAFGTGLALAVGATLIDSGPLGWMVSPLVLGLFMFAMSKAPVRDSLLTLTFFALILENPGEMPAAGAYKSPFWALGALLLVRIKRHTGVDVFFLSGIDLILGFLILLIVQRRRARARFDGRPSVPAPKPLIQLAYLSIGGMVYAFLSGMLRGGDSNIAMTQMDRVFYLPVVFLVFLAGLRGTRDYVAFGKVIVGAAMVRSLMAVYVQTTVDLPPNPDTGEVSLPYGTTHHDSMLFAWASVIVIALIIQRVPGALRTFLLVAPVLIAGMIYNQRRMVWVQIIIVFLMLYFATPPNPMKRKIKRSIAVLSPAILAYIVAGWNSKAGIFKPVQTIRSSVDSEVDASTLWRDIENFNLLWTIRQNPVLGTGYGHGFIEFVPLPPIDYYLELYVPHNSILGLWAYTGYFGYTALTLLWVAGVYFATRAYLATKKPLDKAAALAAFAAVPIYYLQCYGDMGLGSWTGVFMVGPGIAVGAQLATAAGSWSARSPARSPGADAAMARPAVGPEPATRTAT